MRTEGQRQVRKTSARAGLWLTSAGRQNGKRRPALLGALLGCSAAFAIAVGPGLASARGPSARIAHTLIATDTAHLHRAASRGEEILETGLATGTLPGSVRAYLNVGPTVEVKFTISTTSGSISGTGSGKLKGRPAEPSFAGRMVVDHGTDRFQHAHGEGNVYGTLNRRTYAVVVQTTGTLHY
jgi:hypothetical protein